MQMQDLHFKRGPCSILTLFECAAFKLPVSSTVKITINFMIEIKQLIIVADNVILAFISF